MDKCNNCGAGLPPFSIKCNYCGSAVLYDNTSAVRSDIKSEFDSINLKESIVINEKWKEMPLSTYQPNPSTSKQTIFKLYKKSLSVFLLLWVALYLYRFNLPDGHTNLSQHNNIVFSGIGTTYWYVRAVLFLICFPLGTAYFFNSLNKK